MLSIRRSLLAALLILLLSGALGFSFEGNAGFHLPGNNYRWLLHSPFRRYLSPAAETFLQLKYEQPARRWAQERLRGQDQRLNDRAQDKNPSLTTQSETTVAVYGSHVVVGWNDLGQLRRTGSISGYGYSEDGGQHFKDAGVIPPVFGGVNLGDPSLTVDGRGNFYFAQISLNSKGQAFVGVAKSDDEGKTFDPPVDASRSITSSNSFQDKEWITSDASGGPHDGSVYVAWTNISSQGGIIAFSRSRDGGRRFEPAIPLSPAGGFAQGATAQVGPEGEIYVAWEDMLAPGIRISKSTDGGRSFGAEGIGNKLVTRVVPIGQPGAPATCSGRRILKGYIDAAFEFPSLAVNPTNGEVYLVYASNPPGLDQSDIFFVRSADGGHSWSQPVRVNDDHSSNDQFMPAISTSANGSLSIIWYDRRGDPDNLKFNVYRAVSTDGGRSFRPNERVSSVPSAVPPLDPNFDLGRPCYMGDYIGIAADADSFYLAWGDNRDQGLTWRTEPFMPTAREATANVAVGDTVFVLGGSKLGYGQFGESGANQAYQVLNHRWVNLAPLPTPRAGAAAVAVGLFIYVLGGSASQFGGASDAFERYDILTNSWEKLPPLPTPRSGLGAAVVGDKIYAIGGQDCSSDACGRSLNTVEVYDLRSGRWSAAAPMPTSRTDLTATVVYQGQIYVFGGFNLKLLAPLRTVEVYDPARDRWTRRANMPYRRGGGAAAVCGKRILLFGGFGRSFSANRRTAQLYDPLSSHWQSVASPKFARVGIRAAAVGEVVYAIGGSLASAVREAGANEAFNCRNLGYARPDPDIFFARLPAPQPGSFPGPRAATPYWRAPSPLRLRLGRIRLSQLAGALRFQVQGQGITALQLEVFDLAGRRVFQSRELRGSQLIWSSLDAQGRPLANGVYLYRIRVRSATGRQAQSAVHRLVLVR